MNKVLDLLGENKKTLFKYAEDNKIECYKVKKNVYGFNIIFLNMEHKCEFHIYNNIVYSIQLFLNKDNRTYNCCFNDLVDIYKDNFNSQYGNPISDNTNHPTDNIAITYKNDKHLIYIFGQSSINQIKISINRFNKEIDAKTYSFNPKLRYLLYLIGGLLWGLLMFFAMSYKDYSWTNFGIWMIGGLIWALLFGLIFEIFINFAPKQAKIKLKQINKIEEDEKQFEYEISSCGQVYFLNNKRNKSYTAKIYLNDNIFKIIYYKKGKIYNIKKNIELLAEGLGFGHLVFEIENKRVSFSLYNREEFNIIKEHIDEKLGYHSSKFVEIYSLVKKIIIEYNPYSLYSDNNKNVFDYEIDIISRRIFEKGNMSLDELKEEVMIAFDYDYSSQINVELPTILYKQFYK